MSDIIKAKFSFTIREGDVPLEEMLNKIDMYHIQGKLTDAERESLISEARAKAVDHFAEALDTMETFAAFGKRISALEAAVEELRALIENPEPSEDDEPTPPAEYVEGKWYYTGDRVTYKGKVYTCAGPNETFPVVWSPEVTPQYWILDEG